ncbi:MAG TPA: alpha/beta hydrolase [Anaerolineae bacterium]
MTNWTADDGTLINYETYGWSAGSKETLLLLPGLLGAISSQWRNFIQPLSADFRLILMDLRGHGRSQNQAADLQPARMLQDISGLLDSLGVDLVHVAGYSLGGYLGLMLALNQPRRVSTLLMHGTKFYWTQEAAAKMREQLEPDTLAAKVPAYADQLVKDHGARQWRALVRQAADLVSLLVEQGLTERMASHVQCPVLVSVGERDELIPIGEAQRLSRLLPHGALIVLPGVRHPFQTIRPVPLLPMMQYFHKTAYRK